jgi:hypothetical protein
LFAYEYGHEDLLGLHGMLARLRMLFCRAFIAIKSIYAN